jgi:NAD(P) transhydrogenase
LHLPSVPGKMDPMESFDFLVIGTGPAGQRAAIQAAKVGRKVGICERREVVGGVCINTGTIPSKTFREAVLHLTGFQQRGLYGASYTVKEKIRIEDLLFRCDHVVRREIEVIRDQMRRNGVNLISGSARFLDPWHLVIQGAQETVEVKADTVIIAAGTVPALPRGVVDDGRSVITSDSILQLKEMPRTLLVIGAGVVGVEYATMFGTLGVRVILIDRAERLLEFVDSEIVESLTYQMRQNNCTLRLGEEVALTEVKGPGQIEVTLKSGKRFSSDLLLYATGRRGATSALNLEAAGLAADVRGRILVNERFQTALPHIYAAGDIIGFPALASTSMEQGRLAACYALGLPVHSTPALFPYGIYSIPEISMVGQTEGELTRAGVAYETGVARYREIARGAILGDDSGLLKLLFHRKTREILGVHAIGTGATELIHIGQAVLAYGGTLDYFVNSVFNYPTFAECYKVAALDGYNKVGP